MAGRSPRLRGAAVTGIVAAALALAACAPEPDDGSAPPPSPSAASPSAAPSTTPTASPTASAIRIPDDCRTILSADVQQQLAQVPLNDPAFGPSGAQADGSLICNWGDPGADTTGLRTVVSGMDRGPALDLLNDLVATEGFSCYTPDEGTRCEKTSVNPTYLVTDGRTLYWRDGILIDTTYSNLAPTGYTAGIIAAIFA